MSKKFSYKFDVKTKIQFKFYYGLITIDDISYSWEFAFENNLIPKDVKGFILDYRNATFDLKPREHSEISAFYRKHINIFNGLKIAIITDNPQDVVIPILVKAEDVGYFSEAFSTTEAAIKWVLK